MDTHLPMRCSRHAACSPPRLAKRPRSSLAVRLAVFAIALMGLSVMSYGEHWLLDQPLAYTNELTVATCAFDAVHGGAGPMNACTNGSTADEKGNSL